MSHLHTHAHTHACMHRCMDDGTGEVAFVKDSTFDDYNAGWGNKVRRRQA